MDEKIVRLLEKALSVAVGRKKMRVEEERAKMAKKISAVILKKKGEQL